jgi:uncharacterized membrane protein
MEPKRSKYDTNPLDENVADRADEVWGRIDPGLPTDEVRGGPTQDVGPNADRAARANPESESPTRRIDGDIGTSYPSIFVPKAPQPFPPYQPPPANIYQPPPVPPPGVYQPPPVPIVYPTGPRKVAGLGIPEKWAVMLPYLPFYLAIVASVIELILVPKSETRVRFHAAQGLALQIGITAITLFLRFAGLFSGRFTGASFFGFASTIFLIVAMVRVWKGMPFHIPPLEEPAKWLEDKIKPRK